MMLVLGHGVQCVLFPFALSREEIRSDSRPSSADAGARGLSEGIHSLWACAAPDDWVVELLRDRPGSSDYRFAARNMDVEERGYTEEECFLDSDTTLL